MYVTLGLIMYILTTLEFPKHTFEFPLLNLLHRKEWKPN